MYSVRFAVDTELYAICDARIREHNRDFLTSVDTKFFEHVARVHSEAPEPEQRRAAQALRLFYGLATETLLSFLFAALQAPEFVPGWLLLYKPRHLESLATKLNFGQRILTRFRLEHNDWRSVSELVHCCLSLDDKPKEQRIKQQYAGFWQFLAAQFLSERNRSEYNSIKHGLRAGSGGFVLRMGREHEYGVAPPPEEMETIMASEYGSSFFEVVPLKGKRTLGVRSCSTNWDIEAIANSLLLTSMSLSNIVSFLRFVADEKGETLPVSWPADLSMFEKVQHGAPGQTSAAFGPAGAEHCRDLSKEEILEVYSAGGPAHTPG